MNWPARNHLYWDNMTGRKYHKGLRDYISTTVKPPKRYYSQTATAHRVEKRHAEPPKNEAIKPYTPDRSQNTLATTVYVAKNFASAIPVGKALIPMKYHYFKKEVPFGKLFEELTTLQLTLKQMNPAAASNEFIGIFDDLKSLK